MPRRLLLLPFLLAALSAAPAQADPAVDVRYDDGLLRVTLEGSYAGRFYQVWRAGLQSGPYDPLSAQYTLCTGDCFLYDARAVPGQTYWYRFDLLDDEGGVRSYGPYAVTVPDTPLGARVWPNPSKDAARIDLSVPGSPRDDAPLAAQARILDLQGRTVRLLHAGELRRGVTSIAWDGRGDDGQTLRAGVYFVRLATPLGASTARLVRFR